MGIYSGCNKTAAEEAAKKKEEEEATKNKGCEAGKLGENKCRRRFKVESAHEKQLRKEVQEFMAWKGIEKHPFLNITVDKSKLRRSGSFKKPKNFESSTVDKNNNVEKR